MLKQNWRLISRLERLGDFIIIIASFFAAYYGRDVLLFWNDRFSWSLPFAGDDLAPIRDYFIILLISLAAYGILLSAFGAYNSMRLSTGFQLFKVSFASSVMVFFILASTLFLLKQDLSRSLLVLFCILGCIGLVLERYFVLLLLRFYRRRGRNYRNLIICGVGEQAIRVSHQIALMPELGIRIRGFAWLKDRDSSAEGEISAFKRDMVSAGNARVTRIITGKTALIRVIEECAIDEVIFTDVVEVMPQIEEIMVVCAEKGVRTTLVADLFSMGVVKSGISHFGGMPLIHYQTPPGDGWDLAAKRILDILVSALAMVFLLPVFLLVSIAIRLDSPGPIFFAQRRVGLNGRLFYMFKFRSMFQDSARQLSQLQGQNEMRGPVFKMKEDPRITRVGRFLRRFSLDELPQLWNVFIGEMSLVGPRPPLPGEVSMYGRKNRRRLSMRPGITCTWQVSGRNDIKDFSDWVKLDLDYIDNWSLSRDLALLLRTIPAVLLGTGAR